MPENRYALMVESRYRTPFVMGPFETKAAAQAHATRYSDGSPVRLVEWLPPDVDVTAFEGVPQSDVPPCQMTDQT